jgi:hypothetical protein
MAAPAEVPPGAKRALSHTAAPLHISYHFVFGAVFAFVFLCYPFPLLPIFTTSIATLWSGRGRVCPIRISAVMTDTYLRRFYMTHTYFTEPAVGGASKMVRRGLEPTTQPIGTKPVRW